MRRYRQDLLRSLGFDIERYYVGGWPPVWGLALRRDNRDVAVIESHGCHTEVAAFRNKYVVRAVRATRDETERGVALGTTLAPPFNTQREAAAWVARRF